MPPFAQEYCSQKPHVSVHACTVSGTVAAPAHSALLTTTALAALDVADTARQDTVRVRLPHGDEHGLQSDVLRRQQRQVASHNPSTNGNGTVSFRPLSPVSPLRVTCGHDGPTLTRTQTYGKQCT